MEFDYGTGILKLRRRCWSVLSARESSCIEFGGRIFLKQVQDRCANPLAIQKAGGPAGELRLEDLDLDFRTWSKGLGFQNSDLAFRIWIPVS